MLVFFPLFLCSVVQSARILGVYPMPSLSHQVVFRALTLELAKRGHELVVITPNPALPKDRPKDNIREIHTDNSYRLHKQLFKEDSPLLLKRGVVSDVEAMRSDHAAVAMFELSAEIMNNDEVNELLQDGTQKFDLVIAEALLNYHFIFAKIYDAPLIVVSSFYGLPEVFEMMGTVARHPLLYPNSMRNKFKDLTFFDKIKEIYNEYRLKKTFSKLDDIENAFLKNKFGKDAPTVDELKNLVSVALLNSFPIFDNNRPVPPNVVYLGALHLQPVKELPEDLKEYLDNSKRGVVYVSLGTNVHPSMMDEDLLDAFLTSFQRLPYDILWKFDGDNLKNVAPNVRIQKWFPQRDLMVHPNIKVFVTQGGLQSTDEAIDAGVPLVGIPMLGDQWNNVNKYVEFGIGVQLDVFTLTADDIVNGVKTVVGDSRFKQNIKRLKEVMLDTPQSPIERAVWWTEYVLRHKGAKHLKSPAANMSYAEYYMLDLLLYLVAAFAASIIASIFIVYYLISLCTSKKSIKVKRS